MARDRELELAERTADAALAAMPVPLRILDLGCGYGDLVREFVARVPYCRAYVGVDDDVAAMHEARELTDARVVFVRARPESLPFATASFDLVASGDGFGSWADQRRGIAEMARVLTPTGTAVLVDRGAGRGAGTHLGHKEIPGAFAAAGLPHVRRESVGRRSAVGSSVSAFVALRTPPQ